MSEDPNFNNFLIILENFKELLILSSAIYWHELGFQLTSIKKKNRDTIDTELIFILAINNIHSETQWTHTFQRTRGKNLVHLIASNFTFYLIIIYKNL